MEGAVLFYVGEYARYVHNNFLCISLSVTEKQWYRKNDMALIVD
jgi:hypothetical protein